MQVAWGDTLRTTALIHDPSLYSYCIPGPMGKPQQLQRHHPQVAHSPVV